MRPRPRFPGAAPCRPASSRARRESSPEPAARASRRRFPLVAANATADVHLPALQHRQRRGRGMRALRAARGGSVMTDIAAWFADIRPAHGCGWFHPMSAYATHCARCTVTARSRGAGHYVNIAYCMTGEACLCAGNHIPGTDERGHREGLRAGWSVTGARIWPSRSPPRAGSRSVTVTAAGTRSARCVAGGSARP